MPAFEDSGIEGKKVAGVTFTAARIVEATGGRKYEEVWLLTGDEAVDDWNNWVVAIRILVTPAVDRRWVFNRIVPWWGEYVHVCRPNDH